MAGPSRSPFAAHWGLDPSVVFLNHGSFGACPKPVLALQQQLRSQLEAEPVRFFSRELPPMLDQVRVSLGAFVGCDPDDLALIPNATHGVNTVLRALTFERGDELLVTDHAYNACRNALDYAAGRAGASVVVAKVPFPIAAPEAVVEAVLGKVTARTRLALIDHITSPTGMLFPVEALVKALEARGVQTLVDGAHAPGMVALQLQALGASYYTGNLHKWLCAPKGAAFLHVRKDRQNLIRPLSISHGANSQRTDRSRFRLEFDWAGTDDPTAHLCVPEAIRFLGSLLPGGWTELLDRNHAMAVKARGWLCEALGVEPPCPPSMLGSLAAVRLPDGDENGSTEDLFRNPFQDALFNRFQIEVPIFPFPRPPHQWLRVSAQLYNTETDYQQLAAALRQLLPRG